MKLPATLALLVALAAQAAAAAPIPASALLIRQTSSVSDWRWRAAPEAATAPGLLAALRKGALADAAKAGADAARDAAAARKQGYPFHRYQTLSDWSLAADTPHLLVLAGEIYAYTGGAHGNTGYAARIWDKTARRAIALEALFTDWPKAKRLIEAAFCAALAEEQARRSGGQKPAADFAKCPRLSDQPVIPWAGLASRAPQFRVLVGPYVAGPYSDGSYLVTAPWPDAVKPLVKPQYRDDLFGDPS